MNKIKAFLLKFNDKILFLSALEKLLDPIPVAFACHAIYPILIVLNSRFLFSFVVYSAFLFLRNSWSLSLSRVFLAALEGVDVVGAQILWLPWGS